MKNCPYLRCYEDERVLQRIAKTIEEQGGKVFLSSVDALQFAHQKGVRT